MNSLSDLRLVRIAVIGALVAALGLAGCGRKGGLDPPPGATAAAADQAVSPGAGPPSSPDALPPSTHTVTLRHDVVEIRSLLHAR